MGSFTNGPPAVFPNPPSGPTISFLGVTGDIFDVPQFYETIAIPNTGLALYQLYITDSNGSPLGPTSISGAPPGSSPGIGGQAITNFIFPMSPDSLNYSSVNLTSYFETQGVNPAADYGVRRIIDQYGVAPPVISIAGTTGFKYHSLDGFQWDGKQSVLRLENFVYTYAVLVQQAAQQGQPVPLMFLNDGWKQITWQVVPIGPQNFQMSTARPLITNYIMSFIATQPAQIGIDILNPNTDFIVNDLFSPQPIIALIIQAFIASAFGYMSNGLANLLNQLFGPLSILPGILQGPPAP